MNQSIITADFYGTSIAIIAHEGRRWLTAEQVGLALGYKDNHGISTGALYNRNKRLFRKGDTIVISLAINSSLSRPCRLFSESGCVKLGCLSRAKRADEFLVWAARGLKGRRMGKEESCCIEPLSAKKERLADTLCHIEHLKPNGKGTVKITREIEGVVLWMRERGHSHREIGRALRISAATAQLLERGKYPLSKEEAAREPIAFALKEG